MLFFRQNDGVVMGVGSRFIVTAFGPHEYQKTMHKVVKAMEKCLWPAVRVCIIREHTKLFPSGGHFSDEFLPHVQKVIYIIATLWATGI